MNDNAALDQIREVLVGELGVSTEQITLDANLRDDLELDSIDLVELVSILEDWLGDSIDKDSAENIRTIDDVVQLIVGLTIDGHESTAVS